MSTILSKSANFFRRLFHRDPPASRRGSEDNVISGPDDDLNKETYRAEKTDTAVFRAKNLILKKSGSDRSNEGLLQPEKKSKKGKGLKEMEAWKMEVRGTTPGHIDMDRRTRSLPLSRSDRVCCMPDPRQHLHHPEDYRPEVILSETKRKPEDGEEEFEEVELGDSAPVVQTGVCMIGEVALENEIQAALGDRRLALLTRSLENANSLISVSHEHEWTITGQLFSVSFHYTM